MAGAATRQQIDTERPVMLLLRRWTSLSHVTPSSQRRQPESSLARSASCLRRWRERRVGNGRLGRNPLCRRRGWRRGSGNRYVGCLGLVESRTGRVPTTGRRVRRRRGGRRFNGSVMARRTERGLGTAHPESPGRTEQSGQGRHLARLPILAGCMAGWRSRGSG